MNIYKEKTWSLKVDDDLTILNSEFMYTCLELINEVHIVDFPIFYGSVRISVIEIQIL